MVVDTRYYDTLQIQTDADDLSIKKVFFFFPVFVIVARNRLLMSRRTGDWLCWYISIALPVNWLTFFGSTILTRILIRLVHQKQKL